MEIIVGTAGHIDHGKTALVRALTGTDADRLPEEKERGITIDIGFAELSIGDTHFGFVDVPGHERFVKNMLAGASGIDLVLLVIAADEGVMPQTLEHFEICRLLGLKQGIVVITKSDLVDEEYLGLAKLEAAELIEGSFLEDAPVIAVSSVTDQGIDELRRLLVESAARLSDRDNYRVTFLPIDRSFTVKGFGAVVTGTLASGEIAEGNELELLPQGRRVRVRGVQVHGRAVASAQSGQRTAVNLAGIDHHELSRGMVLSEVGAMRLTQMFDAEVEVLGDVSKGIRSRQRIRIHIGTAEVFPRIAVIDETGEIASGSKGFVQFRLESPIASFLGQRFIVRSYSPQTTIGGGQVVVANAEKIKRKETGARSEFLSELLESVEDTVATARLIVESHGEKGSSFADLKSITGWRDEPTRIAIDDDIRSHQVVDGGGRFIAASAFSRLLDRTLAAVNAFHKREPLASGMPREVLRERAFKHLPLSTFNYVLNFLETTRKLAAVNGAVRLSGHQTELSRNEKTAAESLIKIYREARFEPPKLADALAKADSVSLVEAQKLFLMLVRSGQFLRVTDELFFAADVIEELTKAIRTYADATTDRLIDVAGFKQIAGVSRKYAIPLLEYFDREKVTVRSGEKRIVLK